MHIARNFLRLVAFVCAAAATIFYFQNFSGAVSGHVRLQGHLPKAQIAAARHVGRLRPDAPISLSISLNVRNEDQLKQFIHRVYDKNDPLYGHYLTRDQFIANFGATANDKSIVAAEMSQVGLQINGWTGNVLKVSGPSQAIEKAFNVEMHEYATPDGHTAYTANDNPSVSSAVANRIIGIHGLSSFSQRHPYIKASKGLKPNASGPLADTLTPADVKTAYNLTGITNTGTGQTLGLVEFDSYTASDITAYAKEFSLTPPTLDNVYIDGFDGTPGNGADEVTLDIELLASIAPGAKEIIVYQAAGTATDQQVIDLMARIADDNLAQQVSCSWGGYELGNTPTLLLAENAALEQMTAQGQTFIAAAGDDGAYDDYGEGVAVTLSVDDPGSQPFTTAAGGTRLTYGSNAVYVSETSWNDTQKIGAGGGGISVLWPIPEWQLGLGTTRTRVRRRCAWCPILH